MTRTIYLYDHPDDRTFFLPFSQSRPIGELRFGAHLVRERWDMECGDVAAHVTVPHLADFTEPEAPPALARMPDEGDRWCIRSSCVPDGASLEGIDASQPVRLTQGGVDVGCHLPPGTPWPGFTFPSKWPAVPFGCRRLAGVWELVGQLSATLQSDLKAVAGAVPAGRVPAGCTIIGPADQLIIDESANVEPLVVFDTRNGPIWIQGGVEIRTFTRLSGPLVVGRGTRLVGGQVRESSIGPMCVVHGEVSNTVFLGYANKSHDGFLGHSVVGRWVNLGAGTINSNLKNTYGNIRLNLGSERVETGMQFMGSLLGDHVKTAIGTMLPTGCVVGTGANLFGSRRPDTHVAPFAWGTDEPGRQMACRMFLQTASKVLPRRQVEFDERSRRYLEAVWTHCTGQPCA